MDTTTSSEIVYDETKHSLNGFRVNDWVEWTVQDPKTEKPIRRMGRIVSFTLAGTLFLEHFTSKKYRHLDKVVKKIVAVSVLEVKRPEKRKNG